MDIKKIESKWQKYWIDNKVFEAKDNSDKEKYYYLVEFPYPSGAGLHVGHARSYTALDCLARKKRMNGYNVLFPMGWDAFGAPAEQYAIKNKIHPSSAVGECIKVFKGQMQSLGFSLDWSREFSTTDPEYYKWTQWQFLKFFEHGMAYKALKNINWCPNCKIGLSNEDSSGGVCERCGSSVVQKEKNQWMLRMSDYSEQLLAGLDDTKFHDRIKTAQVNWIGKSVGAEVKFSIAEVDDSLIVYTTRIDTLYGVTFMVVAPEHPIIENYSDKISNMNEINAYKDAANSKSEFERVELNKEKTGVKIEGLNAINPATGKNIPIYISDYVMMNYGTGAIMAVPAHDERDYEFAKKFGIDIIQVLENEDGVLEKAFTGDGVHINSDMINGLGKDAAIKKMLEWLEENDLGNKKTNYKLQDWIFSRQRFWGEPIPIIHCPDCGSVADNNLPVLLPDVSNYEPTDDGESPLANILEWVNVKCPKCGMDAKRETDTMPNWAGSSWYYLRYMDPSNNEEFASKNNLNYFGKVDFYNGGMEHATRHLLYARFWNQFLYNIGLVPNKEPFETRIAHGMILGEGGEKMSKSKGNVVNPDDMVKLYGADSLRCYEMFIGDYEKEVVWSEAGLKGCRRFIDRVIKISDKLNSNTGYSKGLEKLIHKTIKKVTEDYDNIKFNTVVSALMILLNEYDKAESISKDDYRILLVLFNPIAPHITEELNELYSLGDAICNSSWPKYDESMLIDDVKDIAVQVNGKVRATISIGINDSEDLIKEKALSDENVIRHTEGMEIVKFIVIKGRIVNIVVK